MVDETAFRQVLRSAGPRPCIFCKAILAGSCGCWLSAKHYIAERETVVCLNAAAHAGCFELYGLLRHNSAFALKHIHEDEPLTHSQEMKLQCGGLLGLQLAVDDGSAALADAAALVEAAREKFGSLEKLPYASIIQSVSASKLRKRHAGE